MDSTTFCVDSLSELFYSNLKETEDFSKHLEHYAIMGPFIMRAALIKNLKTFDDEMRCEVPSSWRIIDCRPRTVITLLGEITYKRRVYLDEYRSRRYLLDEVLGIGRYQRFEKNAFLWVVYRAADVSFEKTARAFLDRTAVKITRQSVMRCVHKAGELLAKSEEKNSVLVSNPVLFCEFDGFYVNLQSEVKHPAMARHTYKEQFKKKSCELKVWVAYPGKDGNRRLAPFHWASDVAPSAFFTECLTRTSAVFDMGDIDYLVSSSDAATWCKNHGLEAEVAGNNTTVISKLDVFHINQRIYCAFPSEEDRDFYLKLSYSRQYLAFIAALKARMASEPCDERQEKREELLAYISNNLDWLEGSSLSKLIRERLLSELPAVFGDRYQYLCHLHGLLSKRRYKRFLRDLGRIATSCSKDLRYDYQCFLDDAKEAIRLISVFGKMSLGTIEGTNAKVYAARLKVWGCAWSRHGALAMMRIRAAIASGIKLVAPDYDPWLTGKEKRRIEAWRERSFFVPESKGRGWEPPRASMMAAREIHSGVYEPGRF